jgi:truncated hemoglobin YjbI
MNEENNTNYGIADTSYLAAGSETGINILVNRFFERMRTDPRFSNL